MDNRLTVYQCRTCAQRFIEEDYGGYEYIENHLLGHCRIRHGQVFDKFRNLETRKMVEACYHKTVYERLLKR